MTVLDIFTGESDELRYRERLQRELEDGVFKLQDGEDKDLGLHVRSDIPRFQTLNNRGRLSDEKQSRKADRNLMVSVIGLFIVGAKVYGVPGLVGSLFQFIGRLLTGG